MSESALYRFSNGVSIRRSDLLDAQVERYGASGNPNLHEPVEEEWLLKVFAEAVPPRPVFLDIGAGVGYYSILVKLRWPHARVIAVEPLPRHAAALRLNWAANGLDSAGIELIEEAVADTDGVEQFRDAGYGSALASLLKQGEILETRARALSRVLDEIGDVHVLKMDIQGAETAVLRPAVHALARTVRHLLVGTHSMNLHRSVLDLLRGAGYKVRFHDPHPPMQPDGLVVASLESI